MTTERPYFGRDARWYKDLVGFSLTYLDKVRNTVWDSSVPAKQRTLLPPELITRLEETNSPEEVFELLNQHLSAEGAQTVAQQNLSWLVDAASKLDGDVQPLILMAITHSVDQAIPNLTWLGVRVGKVLSEYIEALRIVYEDSHGKPHTGTEVHEAKVHRDSIEFFCFNLFGRELSEIRSYLARFVPEHFLYGWEELDENNHIVMRDLKQPRRYKKANGTP